MIGSLVVLPGCRLVDWIKEKICGPMPLSSVSEIPRDGSPIVVSMAGTPLITQKSLETEKSDLLESNPQLKSMIMYMDGKQLDRNLVEGLTNQAIVDKYIVDHSIDKDAKYQEEFRRMMKSVRQMLNAKFFSQGFPISITDNEIQEFYDKNKDLMPQLLISRGGVKAVGLSFDKEQDAKDFLAKMKENKGTFQKTAQTAGLANKINDFKLVHNQSLGIDAALKDKIVAMKVPSTSLVKADKKFWVVYASGKEETKYRPIEQIKPDLRQYLEKEKRVERFDQEIARLKGEYNVVLNEDFFKEESKESANEMPKLAAETQDTQQQAMDSSPMPVAKAA
jgi:hypothetical protein